MKLGKVNVDNLLHGLTAKQFLEWQAYAALEPFGEERQDYRIASICSVMANIHRGSGKRAFEIEQFVLKFGDQPPKQPKTWQEIFAIGRMFAVAANAEHAVDED